MLLTSTLDKPSAVPSTSVALSKLSFSDHFAPIRKLSVGALALIPAKFASTSTITSACRSWPCWSVKLYVTLYWPTFFGSTVLVTSTSAKSIGVPSTSVALSKLSFSDHFAPIRKLSDVDLTLISAKFASTSTGTSTLRSLPC